MKKYYPPVPFRGSSSYRLAGELADLAHHLPDGFRVLSTFGGSGSDANILKHENPALDVTWNDGDNYQNYLKNYGKLARLLARIQKEKLSDHEILNAFAKIVGDVQAPLIYNHLQRSDARRSVPAWQTFREGLNEYPEDYLQGCHRLSKVYRSAGDIPAGYDFYILDYPGPFPDGGAGPYLALRKAGIAESQKLMLDFIAQNRNKVPLAAIYFEKIPGLEIIARKHILKDSRPLLLLGNEKLQKLLNTKKEL